MTGTIGGAESTPVGVTGGNEPQTTVADPGPGDASFSFPQDFESLSDEPLDGPAAPGESQPPSQAAGTPPAAPPQTTAQAAQPAPKAPAAGTPPAQAAQAPAVPQAQPAPPARQPSVAGPPGPQQIVERLSANRDAIVNGLASSRFKVELTKDETTALEENAITALPKILSRLGANLYYEMAVTSLNQINNLVPQLARQMVETTSVASNTENQFFTRWTNLDRSNAEHANVVNFFANTFRAQNPSATPDEAIDKVGRMVSAYLGIAPPAQQGNGGPKPPPPRAPNGSRPFAPAGSGGRPVVPPGTTAVDPWSGMGASFDE